MYKGHFYDNVITKALIFLIFRKFIEMEKEKISYLKTKLYVIFLEVFYWIKIMAPGYC